MVNNVKGINTLYYGDNLEILKRYVEDKSIDLVYLDPPFKSDRDYNVLFAEQNGTGSVAQIKAFSDTWKWDINSEYTYQEIITQYSGKIIDTLQGLRKILENSDMMAYIIMMCPRLIELRRVLKSTGSIYLHCDPTASHYLKILMDAIFGINMFRNEISWCYSRPSSPKQRQFTRCHEILLFYSKSDNWVFIPDSIRIPYAIESIARSKRGVITSKIANPNDGIVLNVGGKFPEDWWLIPALRPNANERLGYPTQKPESLLERIILANSNIGDIVLDPFCGCGTAVSVAQRLNRRWIGIDITHLAINLIRYRLQKDFGSQVKYQVIGEPVCLKEAETLAKEDRYQFQFWALGLVGARPTEEKKGQDRGIDGVLYFYDEKKEIPKKIIIQVKSGVINVAQIRDLRGVLDREQAQIGVLLTLNEPTKNMITEAVQAGFYTSPFFWAGTNQYPRLQIITVKELLNKTSINYPQGTNITMTK